MLYNGNFDFGKPVRITLPTIYSTALSYYEVVAMLANRIEERFKAVEDYGEAYKEYTDNAIREIQSNVDTQLANTLADLRATNQQFIDYVNNSLVLINSRVDNFDSRLTNEIIGVNARTDLAIQQNNEYILEEVGKGFVQMKVINYFTGRAVTVQEMFDYLSQFHLENAITYAEMANKQKTYEQLRLLGITYTTLALNGNAVFN